jgi:hypothetical protein
MDGNVKTPASQGIGNMPPDALFATAGYESYAFL